MKKKDFDRLTQPMKDFMLEVGGISDWKEHKAFFLKRYIKRHGKENYEKNFDLMEKELEKMYTVAI